MKSCASGCATSWRSWSATRRDKSAANRTPRHNRLFAVKAFPESDGRVRLELVPEVQYGRARQRWVGDNQGMLRFEPSRERRVFERMAFDAILSPGHMLVMSSLPTRPGSVGHHFLTECGTGNEEQKLLIVRLSQTQHDDQFNPEVTLAVGE